jgi:hypothetical protein
MMVISYYLMALEEDDILTGDVKLSRDGRHPLLPHLAPAPTPTHRRHRSSPRRPQPSLLPSPATAATPPLTGCVRRFPPSCPPALHRPRPTPPSPVLPLPASTNAALAAPPLVGCLRCFPPSPSPPPRAFLRRGDCWERPFIDATASVPSLRRGDVRDRPVRRLPLPSDAGPSPPSHASPGENLRRRHLRRFTPSPSPPLHRVPVQRVREMRDGEVERFSIILRFV